MVGVLGAAILGLGTSLSGCGRAEQAGGRAEDGGARVVALSPAIAVAMRDLGLAHLLVGRHGWDSFSDPALPVCGDQSGLDYEALLGVRPTHVLIQWGQRELPARLTELAADRGWTVRTYDPLTLDQTRDMARELWRTFGGGESAEPELLRRLDEAWAPPAGADLSRAGRVLLITGVSPPNALGPGSFHHQILERLGGTPAVASGGPFITMDAEDVLHLAPDAIVLLAPRRPGAGASRTGPAAASELGEVLGGLARLNIPAVRDGRVAVIDDPECLLPSTSLVRFAEDLARVISAWGEGEGR